MLTLKYLNKHKHVHKQEQFEKYANISKLNNPF